MADLWRLLDEFWADVPSSLSSDGEDGGNGPPAPPLAIADGAVDDDDDDDDDGSECGHDGGDGGAIGDEIAGVSGNDCDGDDEIPTTQPEQTPEEDEVEPMTMPEPVASVTDPEPATVCSDAGTSSVLASPVRLESMDGEDQYQFESCSRYWASKCADSVAEESPPHGPTSAEAPGSASSGSMGPPPPVSPGHMAKKKQIAGRLEQIRPWWF